MSIKSKGAGLWARAKDAALRGSRDAALKRIRVKMEILRAKERAEMEERAAKAMPPGALADTRKAAAQRIRDYAAMLERAESEQAIEIARMMRGASLSPEDLDAFRLTSASRVQDYISKQEAAMKKAEEEMRLSRPGALMSAEEVMQGRMFSAERLRKEQEERMRTWESIAGSKVVAAEVISDVIDATWSRLCASNRLVALEEARRQRAIKDEIRLREVRLLCRGRRRMFTQFIMGVEHRFSTHGGYREATNLHAVHYGCSIAVRHMGGTGRRRIFTQFIMGVEHRCSTHGGYREAKNVHAVHSGCRASLFDTWGYREATNVHAVHYGCRASLFDTWGVAPGGKLATAAGS